jgi:hypothetical protein
VFFHPIELLSSSFISDFKNLLHNEHVNEIFLEDFINALFLKPNYFDIETMVIFLVVPKR